MIFGKGVQVRKHKITTKDKSMKRTHQIADMKMISNGVENGG